MAVQRHRLIAFGAFAALLALASPARAVPPSNDDRGGATPIAAMPFTETVVTIEATVELDEPRPALAPVGATASILGVCSAPGHTVWYSLTAAAPTLVDVSTQGSTFDTVLAVYGADGGRGLVCNDDIIPTEDFQSQVRFLAQPGVTYLIQAGGWSVAAGSLVIAVAAIA